MTARRYRPGPQEIVVLRLAPGDLATVRTAAGEVSVVGERPRELAGERVAFVPFDPAAVGWHPGTRSATHASGRSTMASLRRVVRGHRLDEGVWETARRALRRGPGAAVYVTVTPEPYYSRTRPTATAVRHADEEVHTDDPSS